MNGQDGLATIRALSPVIKTPKRDGLTEKEGRDIILAIRRGNAVSAVAVALGYDAGVLRSSLGTWAVRYAEIEDPEDQILEEENV